MARVSTEVLPVVIAGLAVVGAAVVAAHSPLHHPVSVVVVSEETGAVSFTHGGKLERALDVEQLRQLLRKYYAQLEEADAFESAVEPETEVGG